MTTPLPQDGAGLADLGPFALIRLLGRGAGGDVWLGRHRGGYAQVAVKVMTTAGSLERAFRARFVDEARAVARLDHPGIVRILDHGTVGEEAAALSGGLLPLGAPWLVMEFARWGTLSTLEPLRSYVELRRVLEALLDALAHAHARGVIHRDLKPSNVLVSTGDRAEPGLKISDFGIAFAAERPGLARPSSIAQRIRAGTPSYMAPEQIRGDLKNQGPWTDLYALGCLAYRLAAGRTPFSAAGNDVDQVLQAHLHAAVPALCPTFATPVGFADWVATLLAKAPWRRFQCCADAAWALGRLGLGPVACFDELGEASEAAREGAAFAEATCSDDAATVSIPYQSTTGTLSGAEAVAVEPVEAETRGELSRAAPPPTPDTWRGPTPPVVPPQLVGAGLGLFGLRPVPLIGREAERDELWAALRDVQRERAPAVVVIRGAAGVGKSRLAEWMTQRCLELGAAEVFKATHGSFPGPTDGLPHLLEEALRCTSLSRDDTHRQVRHVLATLTGRDVEADEELSYVALALTELIRPGEGDEGPPEPHRARAVRFSSQAERYAVVQRLLREKMRDRAAVVWLDDVQWSRDSLGLARALLEAGAPFPALVLLTVRDEALADAPVESTLISRLLATDRARELELRPLSGAEQLELVRAMLGLDLALAEQVRRRTAGNPLFAVQLVGDWVERGMLEVGPEGFGLRGGEAALVELPDDIHDMWRRRLDRLVARFDRDGATRSLELAAALGVDIDGAEWDLACELSGWKVPEGIVEAMVERRMAHRTDRGWCFAHTMLRESLERTARRAGRWPAHHRACCRTLRHMARGEASGVAERLARHLLAAGDRAEALEPLLVAADRHQRCGDYERALVLCELRETALTELEAPPADPRWAEGWLLMARCAYTLSDLAMAEAQLDRVEAQRLSPRPDPLRAAARRVRAQVTRMRGDMRRALALAEQAGEEFKALGDLRSASDCDVIMARLHLESTGDHRTGLALAATARARFSELGAHDGLAECAYITGHLQLNVGEFAEAEASAVDAHRLYELVGDRFGMAACANFRGEIARTRSAFEDAERHYHAAIAILESIGSKATLVPRLNLALVLVQRGGDAFAEAVPLLLDLYAVGRAGKSAVLCYVHYALMACYAFRGDWDLWEEQHARAREHRPESGRTDQDLAAMAQLAGDHAARAGQVERARQAWRLALEHWQALDRPERVAAVRGLLGE